MQALRLECVYVVEAISLDRMKVGWTRSPIRRLQQIQLHCPVPIRLLAIIPGGRKVESIMHWQVRDLQVVSEWFELTDHIREQLVGMREKWADKWNQVAWAMEHYPPLHAVWQETNEIIGKEGYCSCERHHYR